MTASAKPVLAADPWILVGGHRLALRARLVDHGDQFGHGLAVRLGAARHLDVGDVQGRAAFLADADRLLQRGDDADGAVPLVALVGVVEAAPQARLLGHRDHLLGRGEALGRVEEARRQAERAVAHALGGQGLHGLEFGGARRPRRLAQHPLPDRAETDIACEVLADAGALDLPRLIGDIGRPLAVHADDAGRDALHDLAGDEPLGSVLRRQLVCRVAVGVDESRRNDHALRRQGPAGAQAGLGGVADEHDPVAVDTDVLHHRRGQVARVDLTAGDQQVDAPARLGVRGAPERSYG